MKHREKLRLARKLQTPEEAKEKGKGVFESAGWETRADRIQREVKKRESK